MSRTSIKELKKKRDGGGGAIVVVPHVVLNSRAYTSLSGNAIKLLYDIAMQYNTYNNGSLLASWRFMSEKRGWTSNDALTKAKAQLLDRELIIQTVQGHRPNKASWYGLTWLALDNITSLEINVSQWPRGAYARWKPSVVENKRTPPPPETREKHYQKLRDARGS